MPKYLVTASYNADGVRGLIKEGGTGRRAAVQAAAKKAGGKVEAFYFAHGDADAILILDLPAAASALALSLAVNASGAVRATTTPRLTVEELDKACKKTVAYRAPGA